MAASWTSKTLGRLIDIVEDTGELLPDGQIIDPVMRRAQGAAA
ncbi:hypothetical protein [Streptomyces sp. NPDC048637]